MLQESDKIHSDVYELINNACQTVETVSDGNGGSDKVLMLDTKKVWYKTQRVNSPTFGRMALELEMMENKASQCENNMTGSRARVMAKQIMDIVMAYRYSVDAKSSESRRDKHNTQSTLTDTLLRYKVEKQYTIKDEAKRAFGSGFLGKEEDKDGDR